MAFRRSFELGLAWRTALIVAALLLFVVALITPDLRAARIVAALIAGIALASLWSFIRRTNFQVARFVESVRFEDYAQRFSDPSGGGFDVLGDTLDRALKQLQARQIDAANQARYLSAIIDDSPSALLTIGEDGKVELLNKAARQLFRKEAITRVGDLEQLGPEFIAASQLPPGSQKITRVLIEGIPQRTIVSSAHVARLDGNVVVLSLLPAQLQLGELELAAQADLVRVLTHEILNSLTPVTSLARTAAELVANSAADTTTLQDAKVATETVARRAEGISRFVESYREFAATPEVRQQQFLAKPWAEELLQLIPKLDGRVHLLLDVQPATLRITVDPDLVAQAVLNMLRNAIRESSAQPEPVVRLTIRRAPRGRTQIEVGDNGPGIPPERREDIFLPFYTTHQGGSGVGLSFARQVSLAHGGLISAGQAPEGGASISMVI
jgi:nitrogen fixation/metabolism regulation signal transduction histidine kinase